MCTLPQHRWYDCPIDLQPGKEPPWGPIYNLSPSELDILRTYIKEIWQIGSFDIQNLQPAHLFSLSRKNMDHFVVLGVGATENLELIQLDVKTTFLHVDLKEEIYMDQPKGFVTSVSENLVC